MQVRLLAVKLEKNSVSTIANDTIEIKDVASLKKLLPLSVLQKLQLHKVGEHAHLTGRGSNFKLTIWLGNPGSYILEELLQLIWEV